MQAILIAYGTTDGHTADIASFMGGVMRSAGAQVDIIRAGVDGADPSPERYDAVIVAGSLHGGRYQRALHRWARRHAEALSRQPSAMISVCLGILQKDQRVWADLDAKVNLFLKETRWQPSVVKIVAGALLYTRYGWLKRWIMRRIVRKAGVETDSTRDYIYTDWEDLRLFATGFRRRIAGDQGPGPREVARPMGAAT